jgi:hypothetical protein
VCDHLGLALPREDALLVAVDARHALRGHEVCKVPEVLSDEEACRAQPIEGAVVLR